MAPTSHDALVRLAALVREEGGLLASVTAPDAELRAVPTPLGDAVAAARAAAGDPAAADLALVVEAVREGYLLHYAPGAARVVRTDDPHLALLAGDRLYALGLARLADLGDLEAVSELADVIAFCAAAHAAADEELADAVWEAGAAAVGGGRSAPISEAKDRVRTNDPSAASALRMAARQLGRDVAR